MNARKIRNKGKEGNISKEGKKRKTKNSGLITELIGCVLSRDALIAVSAQYQAQVLLLDQILPTPTVQVLPIPQWKI